MGAPKPGSAKTKVLCIYRFEGFDWEDGAKGEHLDAVVIEVLSSDEIEREFGMAVKARRRNYERGFHVGPMPTQWELVAYLTETDEPRF